MEGGGTMKRSILGILIFLLLGSGVLFGVDFGGLIHNETGFAAGGSEESGSAVIRQLDTFNIWFNSGTHNKVVFHAGGSYTLQFDGSSGLSHIFDIYDFKLVGTFPRSEGNPSRFSFTLGRYQSEDFTGRIFSHDLDGFRFEFIYPALTINTDVGFAGFQFKSSSSMQMSKLDYNDLDIASVILGPKRLVGLAEINFTKLFERQTLSVSAFAQEDLRAVFLTDSADVLSTPIEEGETAYTPERGGLTDTQYFLLGLKGPIGAGFYYDVFGGVNTGRSLSYIDGTYNYTPIIGASAGFNVRYYNKEALYSRADLGLTFASGDPDSTLFLEGNTAGRNTMFMPASVIATGTVFTPMLSNLFYLEASYSLKPISFIQSKIGQKLEAGTGLLVFFRSTPAPISTGGLDPASDSLYLGTELDASIDFRLFSDVGFSIAAGWFFPSKAAFVPEREAAWFVGKLTASLSW